MNHFRRIIDCEQPYSISQSGTSLLLVNELHNSCRQQSINQSKNLFHRFDNQVQHIQEDLGAIQVLRNADGGGGVKLSGKNRYESARFNFISITRGWVGVKFLGKKRYVTLEWPLKVIISTASSDTHQLQLLKLHHFKL